MSKFHPHSLPGDSMHYDALYAAAQAIKGVPGVTLEIGLRRGGGTETIIQGCLDNADKRVHMAIDPYGHIPYPAGTHEQHQYDYTNQMRLEALPAIYAWCKEREVTFTFWPMADDEFFRAFPDGPPFYDEQRQRVTEFALVHFDGPHTAAHVNVETAYFAKFSPLGARWVFDDCDMYDHFGVCDPLIFSYGFTMTESTAGSHRRVAYCKDR